MTRLTPTPTCVGVTAFGVDAFGVGVDAFGVGVDAFGVGVDAFGVDVDAFGVGVDAFGVDAATRGRVTIPAIVLIHGAMDRGSSFAKVVRELSDDCFTVTYDRRGYASSVGLAPPVSFDDHVDDLASVLDEVTATGAVPPDQRWIVVGHSYGGNVAAAYAARRPDRVAAVCAYEPPMPWRDWWPSTAGGSTIAVGRAEGPEAAAEAFLRRIVGDAAWERLDDTTRAARRAEGSSLLVDLAGLRGGGVPFSFDAVLAPVIAASGTKGLPHAVRGAAEFADTFRRARGVSGRVSGDRSDQPSAQPAVVEEHVLDDAPHGAHRADPKGFATLVRRAIELADAHNP